jgi:two-component system alkaline phosphatase synthesis response regulator PhoP
MMTSQATDEPQPRRVLVIEDEQTLVAAISYNLRKAGFQVIVAYDGVAGLELARTGRPDAVVLDLMLPKLDGLTVCQRIRAVSAVPILMLTAKVDESDRVLGFELGADDYVTKPFGMQELMARVRALMRRAEQSASPTVRSVVRAGPLEINAAGRTVRRDGVEVAMKPKEFDLLLHLARNAGQVLTRTQLLKAVWGYEAYGGSRTVDVHVRWLREKIEANPARPKYLVTVRNVGYKFVADA